MNFEIIHRGAIMTKCVYEESLELDEDTSSPKSWAESSSLLDYGSVYNIDFFDGEVRHINPRLVPVITTRDLDWYQHMVNDKGQKLINGFNELMVNIYGECSSPFDYHRYASDKILSTQRITELWIDNGAFQLFQAIQNGKSSRIPSDPIIRFKHQLEIVRKTKILHYQIILPDFVQNPQKSLQSYELLLDYIKKIHTTTLAQLGLCYTFRLTVQGTTCKEFRQSAQSVRCFLKDHSFECSPIDLAVTFPLHEFNLRDSKRLLKEMFHIFHPKIHLIPYGNRPRLHLLGETRKEIINYAHQLNSEYTSTHGRSFGIESYDTSRPFFIADELLLDSSFNCISKQYIRWANAFEDTYQSNLLFYCR